MKRLLKLFKLKLYKMRLLFIVAILISSFNINAQSNKVKAEDNYTFVKEGEMAPDFTTEMLDGSKITLSDLKGKVVLLNFWATWCGPCMKEFKEVPEKLLKPLEGQNFVFLPVSRQEKREVVAKKMAHLKGKGIDFPVGLDPTRDIYKQYAGQTIPRNFLIDQNGKIVYISTGYTEESLDKIVEKVNKMLKK